MTFEDRSQARFALTLVVALAVHGAVLFGVRFQQSPPEMTPSKPLRVSLVRPPNQLIAKDAKLESEADHRGDEKPPPPVTEAVVPMAQPAIEAMTTPVLESVPEPRPHLEPEPTPAVAEAEPEPEPDEPEDEAAEPVSEIVAPETPKPKIRVKPKRTLKARDLMRQARQLAQLSAPEKAIDKDKKSMGRSTRYSVREAYIGAWVRKVQDWGTRNFPEEARRQGLTGVLTLRVTIRHDGEVGEILLLRSSGQPVLDEAARDIVALAAPYAPFPPELREQEGDYLSIRRTWQFLQGSQLKSQ